MRKFLLFAVLGLGLMLTANAQKLEFVNLEDGKYLNYGEIDQNADGLRVITFKNTGDAPLILSKVKASCGCTVPSYEKDPVMPGKTAEIKVKYATNRVGPINKVINITSNDVTNPNAVVKMKGKVNGSAKPVLADKPNTLKRQ